MSKPDIDFRVRTYEFARRVLAFCAQDQVLQHGPHVREQLRASATSIGANVEEAKAAHSKRDFLAKMTIARKEAREALYWLRLLANPAGSDDPERARLTDEANQIVAILTATVRTTRTRLEAEEALRASGRRPKGR